MPQPQKRYKGAPIIEEVIEIRIEPNESLTDEQLRTLAESLRSDFPNQIEMRRVQMGFAIGPGAQPPKLSSDNKPFGMRIAKRDDSRVLQLRRDGFAYSHLQPYTEWSIFRSEAHPLWEQYRQLAARSALARCGLRYINRIDIPGDKVDIE